MQEAAGLTGRLDVLVNNAGYGLAGGVEEASEQEVRDQFEVNVFGALWCTQAVLPVMRAQGSGHLFQISSIGGVAGFLNTGIYHASKWALEGFSESLAQEVAGFGIGVTIVEPGPFRTDWNGDSMIRATPMPAYDAVLGARREAMSGALRPHPGRRPAPGRRGAAGGARQPEPPRRLLLGAMAADVGPATYRARLDEWAAWDDVARGADFPAGSCPTRQGLRAAGAARSGSRPRARRRRPGCARSRGRWPGPGRCRRRRGPGPRRAG